MPSSATRACQYGCPNDAQTCPEHGKPAQSKLYDDRRGTAAARGYNRRWDAYRSWYLDELFRRKVPRAGLCGARLPSATLTSDSRCAQQDCIVLGTVVDHIIPVTGPDDPRFYNPLGHQLLCESCHNAKRQRERGSATSGGR